MRLISIPVEANAGHHAGLAMSQWCKERGLDYDVHYDWTFRSLDRAVKFRFFDENEPLASLFILTWCTK